MAGDKRDNRIKDFAAIADNYARDVIAGRVVACKWVRLACERHLNDLQRAGSGWIYHFDRWHANDVCDFIEKLPHTEGKWATPNIRLETPQVFVLAVIFGWRREDGSRRFSTVYVEMARKSAKSTITAAVALYCLCCEGEPGPQIVIGATTGEQAGKVFNPAKKMVQATVDLREAFELQPFSRSIACEMNGGFIQPINAKGRPRTAGTRTSEYSTNSTPIKTGRSSM
jgi:phage terminase large subunit-like protein